MGRGKVFPAEQAKSLLSPLRRLVQSPARTVAAIGLEASDRVLEVGSGPGFFSPFIAEAVSAGGLVTLDLQSEMVTLARQRLTEYRNVTLVQGDASALPLATGRFDAVLLATMLGEVPDQEACVADVRRVLRRGGIVAVAETRRDSDFISLADLQALVQRHAFAFVDRRGLRWQYVARFRAV